MFPNLKYVGFILLFLYFIYCINLGEKIILKHKLNWTDRLYGCDILPKVSDYAQKRTALKNLVIKYPLIKIICRIINKNIIRNKTQLA